MLNLALCIALAHTALAQPAAPTGTQPSGNPHDVIRDLERRANQPSPPPSSPSPASPPASIPAPTDAPSPAGGALPATTPPGTPTGPGIAVQASGRLIREGTFLASRRGRMIRGSDGQWAYAFDADRAGKADPAMTLMPCLNLQSMEKLAERGGESLSFTVSGQVFAYKGRNYFLPTLYAVNRRAEVSGGG